MAGYHIRSDSTRYVGTRYTGRRRAPASGRRHRADRAPVAAPQRIALVVAAVTAVMLGTGALATTLPFQPIIPLAGIGDPAVAPDRPDPAAAPPEAPDGPAEVGTAASVPPASEAPAEARVSPAPSPTIAPSDPPPTDPPAADPPARDTVTIVYEAEQAELSGFVRLFEMEGASGGGVIGTIGLDLLNNVRFPEVTVDTAGAYELTLYYVSAPDRQGMVSVNGGEMVTVDFPAHDDGRTIGSVSMPVELAAGPNVIWFGNTIDLAPALDRITITG
jgi:Carbohydrate binding module (family 35)